MLFPGCVVHYANPKSPPTTRTIAGTDSIGAKSYTYDAAGNTKTVTTGGQVTTLNWNGAGMMSGIAYANGTTNTFTYNGLSQRVGKTDSTGAFAYTLADDAIDSNVLADGAATYQFGMGLTGETRNGASRAYHADALGTTRTTTDAAGAVSSTLETDAFGNVWTPGTTGTQTPFGFAGQHGYQTDADSGLQKLGYRYYDASTGRFLSRDPIQDGRNWYTYCENDPVNAVDPEGLEDVILGPPVPIDDEPRTTPLIKGDPNSPVITLPPIPKIEGGGPGIGKPPKGGPVTIKPKGSDGVVIVTKTPLGDIIIIIKEKKGNLIVDDVVGIVPIYQF